MKKAVLSAPQPVFKITLENQVKNLNLNVPTFVYLGKQLVGMMDSGLFNMYRDYIVTKIDAFYTPSSNYKFGLSLTIAKPDYDPRKAGK